MSKEFNLLDEKWILVLNPTGMLEEVSILEFFENAHNYKAFGGELPTQDASILRLLLAILHATFGKKDDGSYVKLPIKEPEEMTVMGIYRRWKWLWDQGKFPIEYIKDYLEEYRDRFWLFHDERPFYQVAGLRDDELGTEYPASKLNGEISESNNKPRLFPSRYGEKKDELSYSEAARWLVHIMNFDDSSVKKRNDGIPNKDKPASGVGYLGQIGLVIANGNNLFETLMLNFVMLKDAGEQWGVEKPNWHAEEPRISERTPINIPDNLSELMTIQSRRISLSNIKNGVKCSRVVGFSTFAGDFFDKAKVVNIEKMTLWSSKLNEEGFNKPKLHQPETQLWREFSSLLSLRDNKPPGILSWTMEIMSQFEHSFFLTDRQIFITTASVVYGASNSSFGEIFSDSISFSATILKKLNEHYIYRIQNEVAWTESVVNLLRDLANDLAIARGERAEKERGFDKISRIKGFAYSQLDNQFRIWLVEINPEKNDDFDFYSGKWRRICLKTIDNLAKNLIEEGGLRVIVGNIYKKELYTAAKSYNIFKSGLVNNLKNEKEEVKHE